MGIEDVNLTQVKDLVLSKEGIISNIPPALSHQMTGLIMLFKVAGFLFIVYLIFLIFAIVMGIIRNRRIRKTYKIVKELEEKVNFLVDRERQREIQEERSKHHGHEEHHNNHEKHKKKR